MAWSGGTYTKWNGVGGWVTDSLTYGIVPDRHDTQDTDFQNGINNCLTKDGQNTPTANLPMGGFKHTGAGAATANGQYITYDQMTDASPMKVDFTNDRLGINTATPGYSVDVSSLDGLNVAISRFQANANGANIFLRKSRGATLGANTIVQSNDVIGVINFYGANGTGFDSAATIACFIDGTPGASNDMPGAIGFYTTPEGSANSTLRVKITSAGSLVMSTAGTVIGGDFSNATANNKNAIMTTTANDNSLVDIIPNGTATISGIYCNNNSTRTNSGYVAITSSSTLNSLVSGRNGTGTYLPLISITGGSERWRVNTSGDFIVANTVNNFYDSGVNTAGAMMGANGVVVASVDNGTPLIINRKASDTTLVDFRRDGVNVGSITVSGGVVTYGPFAGYHWSQLQDGTAPTIPVGTIVESINELCEWPDETEERLPKCKVSDTVASTAVYGVFSNWDTDWTATNDMSIVSVGAYFCRVAAGTVLQIGDLLESAGNGMAQVQADDIIRSSTIGKVTALTQSHVEADGSFCVPTVLYCG